MGEGEGLQWNDQHSASSVHTPGPARRAVAHREKPIAEGAGPSQRSEGRPRRAWRRRAGRTRATRAAHTQRGARSARCSPAKWPQIGAKDQMFKLHFVDGEGDSVLVSTHTEMTTSATARASQHAPGLPGRQ